MKRKYYILATLLLLLLLVMMLRLLLQKETATDRVVTTFPEAEVDTYIQNTDTTSQVLLRSRSGIPFPVRDFLDDADTYELSDDGIYVIGERSEAVVGQQYQIFYDTLDNSIIVSLRAEPLSVSRALAEEELRTSTGLSDTQLCNALIVVTVPREVSEVYAGRDLGLSFCQGSSRLE